MLHTWSMGVPPNTYAAWEMQRADAERSRLLQQIATERRLREAKARVRAAIRAIRYTRRARERLVT